MDPNYITAMFGLAGAAIGGITSFATNWLTHRSSMRDRQVRAERAKLEGLFSDFIFEASRLYGDALTHEQRDIAHLVKLYALLNRIRLVASHDVIDTAEATMEAIVATYMQPNRSFEEIRAMARAGHMNFLHAFGEACRKDLRAAELR